MIKLKSPREMDIMETAGQLVAKCHQQVRDLLEPGITTKDIDHLVEQFIRERDVTSSFKDYRGFPSYVCTSVNEEVVHGIPTEDRVLEEGDIVSVDIGICYRNYHGDAARTYRIGELSEEADRLANTCKEVLDKALAKVEPGEYLAEVSKFIEEYSRENGYEVVREYVGHGIGREMHEEPQIPNYYDPAETGRNIQFQEGMVMAFEPMLNVGEAGTETLENDWTVVTVDRELSAHFEDTLALTREGPKIFTRL